MTCPKPRHSHHPLRVWDLLTRELVSCRSPRKMSGVEAAASLFGSEDSTSDPFNALGIDSTPTTSFDELFTGSNEVSGTSDSSIFDHSSFSTDDIMYSDSQQGPGTEHPQSFPPEQNGSVGWRHAIESHPTSYGGLYSFLFTVK